MTHLRFKAGEADLDDLRAEIASALRDLADPTSSLASQASAYGFDSVEFTGAESSVTEDAKGFGPILILVAILTPSATHAINKVWDDLIWPRIKSRLGADALGEREESADALRESEESDE
jgi:hypothetical protein